MRGWSLCGGRKSVGAHRSSLRTGGRESWVGGVAELKFLAEKELVTIILNFSRDKTYCIRTFSHWLTSRGVSVAGDQPETQCQLLPTQWSEMGKLEKMKDREHERKRRSIYA